MPTYEYRCRDCGEHLEVTQSFTDDPLTECPACGGSLKKVFSTPAIAFKGEGFYKTDSRGGGGSSSSTSSGDGGTKDKGEKKGKDEGTATKAKDTKAKDTKAEGSKAGSSSS